MSTKAQLGLLAVVGVLARLWLAATTAGNTFDLGSYVIVNDVLRSAHPFSLYDLVNGGAFPRWPYLPGYLPIVVAGGVLADLGLPMERVMRLPPILADLLLAALVVWMVRRRGADDRTVMLAGSAVLIGPLFVLLSGHHGQLDSVAALAALGALALWMRRTDDDGYLPAALLLGLAIAIKSAPAILLLAFIPLLPTWGRRVRFLAATAVVPLLTVLPFLASEPVATISSLRYRGLPGIGGLSVLVQPSLAVSWLTLSPLDRSDLTELTQDVGLLLLAACLGAAAIVAHRRGWPIEQRCAVLWVAFLAGSMNLSLGYVVWVLPFFLVAGWVRTTWVVQLALFPAAVFIYGASPLGGWPERLVESVYVPYAVALQIACAVALAVILVRRADAVDAAEPEARLA